MKSECKIYTLKFYVALEWPLVLHFKHRMCCQQKSFRARKCPPNVIISRTKVLFFLKQHRAPFRSWAEHFDLKTNTPRRVSCFNDQNDNRAGKQIHFIIMLRYLGSQVNIAMTQTIRALRDLCHSPDIRHRAY